MSLIILEGPRVRALLVGEAYECADALRDALESGWFASAQPDSLLIARRKQETSALAMPV